MTARPSPARRLSSLWFFAGGLAVVLVIGVIAIAASRDDGSDDDGDAAGAEVAAAVEIDGRPLPAFQSGGDDPATGERPPVVIGEDFEGRQVTIGERGTPQLLVFLAHWCPHCQAEVPRIVAFGNAGGIPSGLDVVAIATNTKRERDNYPPSAWLAREGWSWPVLLDTANGEVATAYGLGSFPFFVAVDSEGRVVARASGELGDDAIADLVGRALDGVDPSSTPSTAGP